MTAAQLPAGYPLHPDFEPRYDPWDQRMCMVPDGDLFRAISAGQAAVKTGTIDRFTATGIRLSDGEELPADIIVTATGLQLQLGGGAELSVGGEPVSPGDTYVYRGCMLSEVPNFAMCVGYTNASWTLRADLSSQYVCRVLNHMKAHGYAAAMPHHDAESSAKPLLNLNSGYVQRSAAELPKQGDKPPWMIRQNYILDYFTAKFADVTNEIVFTPVGLPAAREEQTLPVSA
jgi:cation diffusion facilitator CzcD-associated flavoprotein CzcO